MEVEELKKFGMTNIEAKIYLEIIRIDETPIGPLIKRTGLHRGTVYNCISSLIKKGFVSFIDMGGIRYYKYSGENFFRNILEEKKRELIKEERKIKQFFEGISRIKEKVEEQKVEVFYGAESFKSLFLEIYDECKKKNIEYFFLGRGGEMQEATGAIFYRHTQKLKKKLNIKCRVILSEETKKLSYHKYTSGNIKYLRTKIYSPINLWIYENVVLVVLFGVIPLTSIKIKSKLLANSFKNYFEYLWKIAKR